MWFSASEYQDQVIKEIETKIEKHKKLYLELVWNCTDQTDFSNLVNWFPNDIWKKVFAHFKYDLDVFFCIRAEDILDEEKLWTDWKNFKEFLAIYLKKIENQYWVKPHIVINGINVENMYDLIFSFETTFQKQGYRVREKYKIKAYETPLSRLLSEDGFGNDDHIPTSKRLIVICGLTPESGKLTTAAAQIYQDWEIWIESGYAKIDPLADYQSDKYSLRNIATQARDIYSIWQYWLNDILENRDVFNKSEEKFKFLQKFNERLGLKIPQNIEDYTIWKLNIDDSEIKNNLSKFLDEEIANADSAMLQEKLVSLKEHL